MIPTVEKTPIATGLKGETIYQRDVKRGAISSDIREFDRIFPGQEDNTLF